jgi:hypothetical protein
MVQVQYNTCTCTVQYLYATVKLHKTVGCSKLVPLFQGGTRGISVSQIHVGPFGHLEDRLNRIFSILVA